MATMCESSQKNAEKWPFRVGQLAILQFIAIAEAPVFTSSEEMKNANK